MNARLEPPALGWSASLELQFKYQNDRTVLARNRHTGPLRVQRAFYPEPGGLCHVYILHPPGGVVAGDSLAIKASVAQGAHGLLTTPSAGRVYRSNEQQLTQSQSAQIDIEDGGFGEWLPQENILFDGAQAVNKTRINLSHNAQFNGWEITCLGRPASQDNFLQGKIKQRLEIYRDSRPLLIERNCFEGGDKLLQARWGLNGATCLGTMVTTCQNEMLLKEVQSVCAGFGENLPQQLAAVTRLPELVVVRAFALNAAAIKGLFFEVWRQVRRVQLGVDAVAPRIWFT